MRDSYYVASFSPFVRRGSGRVSLARRQVPLDTSYGTRIMHLAWRQFPPVYPLKQE